MDSRNRLAQVTGRQQQVIGNHAVVVNQQDHQSWFDPPVLKGIIEDDHFEGRILFQQKRIPLIRSASTASVR